MFVAIKTAIIAAALGIFGIDPVWCDSCGEMYAEGMTMCDICDATICHACAKDYEESTGCYVCDRSF